MRLLRAVFGRLDAWAALLLGVLVALGVIILLATPGPWHEVVGPAPAVERAPASPTDVAVFALAGRQGACTAVIWLHVDHAVPAVTAVVVDPDTEGFLAGAGFMPLCRMVDAAGPAAATWALGQAVGVPMNAWVTLDREALFLALSGAEPAAGRARPRQYRGMEAVWDGSSGVRRAWVRQCELLGRNLTHVHFQDIGVVAFANYVLGFGHTRSDLDLQRVTSLGAAIKGLLPSQVGVCAAPVILETCRAGEAWRADPVAMARLRGAFAAGVVAPDMGPRVVWRPRAARVLVVLPGAWRHAAAYVDEVRRVLAASAGVPVAVNAVTVSDWSLLAPRAIAAVARRRPLAVLVAPPMVAAPAADDAAVALNDLSSALRKAGQPATMSEPLPSEATQTASASVSAPATAVRAGGQPVSPLDGVIGRGAVAGEAARLREAAAANVATLVRACWPGALAPRLTSTRLGFSFAARRRTVVAVLAGSPRTQARAAARVRTWGFQTTVPDPGDWTAARSVPTVYYGPGSRRAALSLAGDLGWGSGAVLADARAPAPLTLDLR